MDPCPGLPDPQTSYPWTLLWGYLKTKVFGNLVTSVDELKARIRNAVDSMRLENLVNTWKELRLRLVKLQKNGRGAR